MDPSAKWHVLLPPVLSITIPTLSSFMGLCQKTPTCPAEKSLTDTILGDIESKDLLSESSALHSKTMQSLAIAVCESLRTTTSQDLLVGVFPLLCRLTNVENDGLRRAAGKVLGSVNLSEAISRERKRAERADIRATEIEEENIAMLEEIEYLQAENEELQRQVSDRCGHSRHWFVIISYIFPCSYRCSLLSSQKVIRDKIRDGPTGLYHASQHQQSRQETSTL